MAGFYPDVPNYKMATDKDGSNLFLITGLGVVTNATSTQINNMTGATMDYPTSSNQVTPGNSSDRTAKLAWVFPEKRDVSHVYVVANKLNDPGRTAPLYLQYSLDTTNGLDGTWTQLDYYTPPVIVVPGYRTGIKPAAVLGCKGIRVVDDGVGAFAMGVSAFHVYGTTAAGQNPHRFAFWHPTLDQELAASAFDWGDVPRSTTQTKTFRVKNLSPSLTANTTRVAMSVLVDSNPSLVTQHALSTDNTTWLAQLALGNVAPGAISPVLYFRRTMLANAQGGVWMMRVFAEATTWS